MKQFYRGTYELKGGNNLGTSWNDQVEAFAAIPEQFVGLNDLFMEQQKIAEPYIDEQTLEQFNYIICSALEHNQAVDFVYYKSGNNLSVKGKIHHWNEVQHKIHLIDFKQKVHYIPSKAIVNI